MELFGNAIRDDSTAGMYVTTKDDQPWYVAQSVEVNVRELYRCSTWPLLQFVLELRGYRTYLLFEPEPNND
jgi:hypothetical protein